jgi:hypothetical protein
MKEITRNPRVLAFGAGTQSTALLIASVVGDIEPYDLIVFEDGEGTISMLDECDGICGL